MSGEGDLLGVLALERVENTFDEDDIALVETVAHQLGLAIERAQANENIYFYSSVSTMTAWASDIAHDINDVVGKIRDRAYLIQEYSQENPKILAYAREIDENAKRFFSVGPWGITTRHPIKLDEALAHFVDPLARQRGIKALYELNASDARINANPDDLQRVFRHLIRNADREMSKSPEKKIMLSTRILGDDKVEILFRDFGPGIKDSAIRDMLFKRPIEKDRGGFGLLLVRLLVENMGTNEIKGAIRLLPDTDIRGATFSITLPVSNNRNVGE
jgi:signal transduction histidine kinase